MSATTTTTKNIFITGANSGIGFALVERLVTEYDDVFVYLGSRNLEKGLDAKKKLVEKHADTTAAVADKIEVIQIDIGDDDSVIKAAAHLKATTTSLYALVNNAGVGIQTSNDAAFTIATNYHGPKRVTNAFLDLLSDNARIVNVSSGAASMWLRNEDAATQALFSGEGDASLEALDAHVQQLIDTNNTGSMAGYALSKAALTAMTIFHAKLYPQYTIVSLSPGFVDTSMTAGYGAPLTPHEGCKSLLKCLFDDTVTSGYYYGSDGLRSPLTVTRDPGTPEYQGEANPDATKYNN